MPGIIAAERPELWLKKSVPIQVGDAELSFFLGESQAMRQLVRGALRLADLDRPVLILGASGSGKELMAAFLHQYGSRAERPFLDVNCGSITDSLAESLLFGHVKGAFTGATADQEGYFSLVEEGTLFLDEVGELPLTLQSKLLRVLETRLYRPIGSTQVRTFRGRIVAATHRDLQHMVKEGRFREDLFHRLNVFSLEVPGLGARGEDLPGLVAHFAGLQARKLRFADDAVELVCSTEWPGNVRQLKNTIEQIAVFVDLTVVTARDIQPFLPVSRKGVEDRLAAMADTLLALDVEDKVAAIESALISQAMKHHNGNKSAAARALGVHRKVLERRVRASAVSMEKLNEQLDQAVLKMAEDEYDSAIRELKGVLERSARMSGSCRLKAFQLEVHYKLAICYRSMNGWGCCAAVAAYESALALSAELEHSDKRAMILFGLWTARMANLEMDAAVQIAGQMFELGQETGASAMICQACAALVNTHFWLGNYDEAEGYLEQFFRYHREESLPLDGQGMDLLPLCLMFKGLMAYQLGRFCIARTMIEKLNVYIESCSHSFSRVVALMGVIWLDYLFGHIEAMNRNAIAMAELCMSRRFLYYEGFAQVFRGTAMALLDHDSVGVEMVLRGFEERMLKNGGLIFYSFYALMLGRVYLARSRFEEGLELVEHALQLAEEKNERCYLSELYTLKAQLDARMGGRETALHALETSVRIADELKNKYGVIEALCNWVMLLPDQFSQVQKRRLLQLVQSFPEDEHHPLLDYVRFKYEVGQGIHFGAINEGQIFFQDRVISSGGTTLAGKKLC